MIEIAKNANTSEIECVCKNTADADGFNRCLPDGTLVGPYETSTPSEHVLCFSCLRIVSIASGLVIGTTKLDADGFLACKHEDVWSMSDRPEDTCQSCGRNVAKTAR